MNRQANMFTNITTRTVHFSSDRQIMFSESYKLYNVTLPRKLSNKTTTIKLDEFSNVEFDMQSQQLKVDELVCQKVICKNNIMGETDRGKQIPLRSGFVSILFHFLDFPVPLYLNFLKFHYSMSIFGTSFYHLYHFIIYIRVIFLSRSSRIE